MKHLARNNGALGMRWMSSAVGATLTGREAIKEGIATAMAADPDVVILGEEVARYDGAYKVTKGLLEEFGPERVIDTPITEYGFTGIGVGIAASGMKPIVEFMTWNFALQAIDHIVNSAAKARYMSDGQLKTPIVFRGPNGPPTSVAAQHSQCFAAWYSSVPGLKVVSPATGDDHKGLLISAINDPDPVVVLEHELLYNMSFDLSPESQKEGFHTPIGKAKIEREGSDVTIVSFSRGVIHSLEAAEALAKEGINAEVINLRTLRPLDKDTIINSLKKTNRIVSAEEGWHQCGIGAEIAALAQEHAFDYLDAPVERVTGADVPMPYSPELEAEAMINPQLIVDAAKRACYRD